MVGLHVYVVSLTLYLLSYLILIFTHLKLLFADATNNFKWVKMTHICVILDQKFTVSVD